MHGRRSVTLVALLVALSPAAAFAAAGAITCEVDPFSKDGVGAKQQLTVTYDGDGPGAKVTVQSPWGTLTYDDALINGNAEQKKIGMMLGGEREAQLPDLAGMEACLSKSTPDQLHDFETLLGLVADCGHALPLGAAPVLVQTLFGISIDGDKAGLTMSMSYSEDSKVAGDYLEFRQDAVCKPL